MPRMQPEFNDLPQGSHKDCEIIQVRNKLREIVGPGNGMDPAALARAEKVVDKMRVAYEDRLALEIENLLTAYREMQASGKHDLDVLYDRVHEIRGEAGTFGYDLVSDIGRLLCELLSPMKQVAANDNRAIEGHLKAMETVVTQKVKGAGPEVGKQIVQALTVVVEKSRN